jgi:lysozyme
MKNEAFYDKYRPIAIDHEGDRQFPYDDATGKPPVTKGKLTIGIGHNLTDLGISSSIRDQLFREDYYEALDDLEDNFPWFEDLDEARQLAMLDLRFNLGPRTFRTFKATLARVQARDWKGANRVFRGNRKYFQQTGDRAEWIARTLETGTA